LCGDGEIVGFEVFETIEQAARVSGFGNGAGLRFSFPLHQLDITWEDTFILLAKSFNEARD